MDYITYQEYWRQVRLLANEALTIRAAGDGSEADDLSVERTETWLHETIDGHEWIIYTFYNTQVLTHTQREHGRAHRRI